MSENFSPMTRCGGIPSSISWYLIRIIAFFMKAVFLFLLVLRRFLTVRRQSNGNTIHGNRLGTNFRILQLFLPTEALKSRWKVFFTNFRSGDRRKKWWSFSKSLTSKTPKTTWVCFSAQKNCPSTLYGTSLNCPLEIPRALNGRKSYYSFHLFPAPPLASFIQK